MRRLWFSVAVSASILAGLVSSPAFSQDAPGAIIDPTPALAQSPVARMVGHWKGVGSAMGQDGQRHEYASRERARWNLAGTAIIVEGLGTFEENGELIVGHNAFALIEMEGDKVVIYARRAGAPFEKHAIDVNQDTGEMRWSPSASVRFIINIDDKTWAERGEMTMDDGKTWREFLSMKLERVEGDGAMKDDHARNPDAGASSAKGMYRTAQALMKEGKHDDGYAAAQAAMKKFVEEGDDLAWMMLESVVLEDRRVDVHFNMGPKERRAADGINRVLTFRVWSKDGGSMVDTFDYEVAIIDGKPLTAAFGKSDRGNHANYGMIDTDAKYSQIREEALALAKTR